MSRPPLPPFTRASAIEKVRLAEDGWNTRDAGRVSLAYSLDTAGATAPNSPMAATRRAPSSSANGTRSSNTA